MRKAMPTAPSAPLVEDQTLVGHHPPPPPNYEQAMGLQPGFVSPPGEPVVAPYPQNYGPSGMMMPPVPPFQPVPVATTTTVFVAGTLPVGPKPTVMCCPRCQTNIKTSTETKYRGSAHIACILLCLCVCWLCSCIPYCMESCKNVNHTCPNCKAYLGTYRP